MKNERIELFIYVNVIIYSSFSPSNPLYHYILSLSIVNLGSVFFLTKLSRNKKIEEVVYNSLIEGLKLIKNRNVQVIVYSSFDGSYKRQDELTKLVKKFYKINFIFNYEDETAKLISKENTK